MGFQDFTRFSVSLYENVGVGCIEKLEEGREVEKALKKGNLTDLAAGLTNGEMTLLGKEYDAAGQELSGGQWQRIALARAYMGEPWLIVLDEPTASIDPMEELRLLQNFKEIIGNRIEKIVDVAYAYQEIDDIPEEFKERWQNRTKPWGTGQAILCCKDVVKEPFLVINADDYYGKRGISKDP